MSGRRDVPIRRLACGICVAVVLLTGLAVGLFVNTYHAVVHEAFIERSTAYATAFSAVADAWLSGGDKETAETTARFLLLGSALYVQVVSGATVLIDERIQGSDSLELLEAPLPSVGLTAKWRRISDGPHFLDVIIPTTLETSAGQGPESGYVRIGVDASTVGERIRSMTLLASGFGFAFDGFVIGLVLWLVRYVLRREAQRRRGVRSEADPSARPAVIVHGALQIDETTKRVSLFGKDLPLPPKQFGLLRLLASDPFRVFSDTEILSALWSTSSYADSKDVKQQVYLLRRRLSAAFPDASKLIVNVPGFGYKLVPPVVDEDLTKR